MSAALSVVSAVFWGAILLSVLVFVHEGGHYLVARAFGMRVTEFFLGMPCKWRLSHKSRDHGTEVGVTPILLGGYNRICGMEGTAGDVAERALGIIASRGRMPIADLADELGVSLDELTSELNVLCDWASIEPYFDEAAGERPNQSDWPAQVQTVERDANLLTAFDSGHDFSLEGSTKAGEPHGLPAGGAHELLASERAHTYQGKGFLARVATLVAGPAINLVVGMLLFVVVYSAFGVTVAVNEPIIGGVEDASIAQAAGIEAGDTIESVNGVVVDTWEDMGEQLHSAIESGEPFSIEVSRDGQDITLTADPEGAGEDAMFGVTSSTQVYHPSPGQSLQIGWNYLAQTVSFVAKLFQPAHTAEVVSQSTSIVGISVMASQAAESGAQSFLFLMAAISLSLGIMNLIPIPPLDGGKLLIEVIELVIRRPLPQRAQNFLSYLGIVLALLLFVAVLRQDIVRFVFGG